MDKNSSIGCNVSECRFHSKAEEYCSLPQIQVTKHESVANTIECTDCGSFQKQ